MLLKRKNQFQTSSRGKLWLFIAFLFAFPFLNLIAQEEESVFETDQCIVCHTEDDNLPEDFNKNDIHLQTGLSCAGCHGGDPTSDDEEIAMDPDGGFVGVPDKNEIPEFCGKCHSDINFMRDYRPDIETDQVKQYFTSMHGKKLKKGDRKVADCSSCHTAHAILPASDPRSTVHAFNIPKTCGKCHSDKEYMAEYGIPTDQLEKFRNSVHGTALLENQDTGAPACNDCHGNHGAMPPGVSSISHVCGTCHVNNMQFFSKTKMAAKFQEEGKHACEECHGNHDVHKTFDDMVGTGKQSVCMKCHDSGDKGYNAADEIHGQLTNLVATYDSASVRLGEVQKRGMDDVDITYLLQEAHQNLIKARTLVHTFDPEKVKEETEAGLTKAVEAISQVEKEIKDFNIRRRGLAIATIFITMLVVALFLKIREIEKNI